MCLKNFFDGDKQFYFPNSIFDSSQSLNVQKLFKIPGFSRIFSLNCQIQDFFRILDFLQPCYLDKKN